MKRLAILTLLALIAAPLFAQEAEAPPQADLAVEEEEAFQPPAGLEEGWYASIETSMGRIVARLLPEQAPQSVAHFVGLAEATLPFTDPLTGETVTAHYYDGMPIHTVLAGRLFETGDAGALGRSMPLLYVPEERVTPINFGRGGRLGHTRMSGARISGVKFFVTASAQPWLNGESPCFGAVVEGQEIVFNISQVKAYSSRKPIGDIWIEKIRVFAIGDPPPIPDPQPYQPKRKKLEFGDFKPDN